MSFFFDVKMENRVSGKIQKITRYWMVRNGVHKDSLEIHELFLDVKMENRVSGKIQKITRYKMGMHLRTKL